MKQFNYPILYIDSDVTNLEVFKKTFEKDFDIISTTSPKDGLRILHDKVIPVIITDQQMLEQTNFELLKNLSKKYPTTKIILLTDLTNKNELEEKLHSTNLWRYLTKPFNTLELKRVINNALEASRLNIENAHLINELKYRIEKFEKMMETAMDPIITINEKHEITDINKAGCALFEYDFNDLIKQPLSILIPPNKRAVHSKHVKSFSDSKQTNRLMGHGTTLFGLTASGKKIPIEVSLSKQKTKDGFYYNAIIRDITKRLKTEALIVESEERFKLAMMGANDGLWDYNILDNRIYYSPRYKEMLGYGEDELKNEVDAWHKILHPDDTENVLQEFDAFLHSPVSETNYKAEFRLKHKNGAYLNILSRAFGLYSESGELTRIIGTHVNITPIKKVEHQLLELNENLEKQVDERTKKLVTANERLQEQHHTIEMQKKYLHSEVKEIHHRVKNNLQIVNSLLSFQSRNIEDKKTLDIFKEVQNRVISMSLLHETLYRTDDIKNIRIENYFKQLIENLVKNYEVGKNITLNLNIENLNFGLKTLVPLGLIINEIITNTLKYAFNNGDIGIITISLVNIENQRYKLLIGDNGVGIDQENWETETPTLGKKLIHIFVKQLDGSIKLLNKKGTNFEIVFKNIDD